MAVPSGLQREYRKKQLLNFLLRCDDLKNNRRESYFMKEVPIRRGLLNATDLTLSAT
jgi:hypothetical protein